MGSGDSSVGERRTHDVKVSGSSPGRSGGRFYPRVNFLCWLVFSRFPPPPPPDLPHSVLSQWTVLLPKWFQVMMVLERRSACIVRCCSAALYSICRYSGCKFSTGLLDTGQVFQNKRTNSHWYYGTTGPSHDSGSMLVMKWCLMSSDVSWHIRDKLWPMPKHGSI